MPVRPLGFGGRSIEVPYSTSIARWIEAFRYSVPDSEAKMLTVRVIPPFQRLALGGGAESHPKSRGWRKLRAKITYGIGSAQTEFVCDVGDGVSVNLPASVVRVELQFASDETAAAATASATCTVFIGPYAGQANPPTYTEYQTAAALVGDELICRVPACAKDVTLYTDIVIAASMYQVDSDDVYRYRQDFAAGDKLTMPIIPGTVYLSVVNNGPGTLAREAFVFGLNVGS